MKKQLYHAYSEDTQGNIYKTKYSNLAQAIKEEKQALKEDETLIKVTIYDYKHGKKPIELIRK